MSRRVASLSLLCAWLCASGAMLDVAQVFAWARMYAGYARTESIVASARDTFDPGKPCAICRALSRAREACGLPAPAAAPAAPEKIVLILERAEPFIALADDPAWPEAPAARALAFASEVPVPPPRFSPA
jgi:hypothetical protein